MENISRGPTFGDFVTIRTERSIQDVTVSRLQSTRVLEKTTLSPFFKCNVLRESLFVDSQNIPCAGVVGNLCRSDLMLSGDPVLGHVDVDNRTGLHEQLPQERLIHLEHKTHF
jgi:hypothetical protein